MSRTTNRLYVAGHGNYMVFTLATCLNEAKGTLGIDCRTPDSDDIRNFWKISGIANMTTKERLEKFNVSRQTVHHWRKKGGEDLKKRSDIVREEREKRIVAIIKKHPDKGVEAIAELANACTSTVRKVAAARGLKLASVKKMPSDDELVQLATGRTWREFAEAVGLKLATLRNHIYTRKELAERIRQVRKRAAMGHHSKGRINLKKVRKLGQMGMSAYMIAEKFKVEQMTIRAHLMKWGKEKPDEFFPPYGKRRPPGQSVDGSNGGIDGQQ